MEMQGLIEAVRADLDLLATGEPDIREEQLIRRLALAAECHDAATGEHIERMAKHCQVIAAELGLGETDCDRLLKAAPMHDIGKIGLPDSLLTKPDRLDPAERALMQRHTLFGHEILAGSQSRLIQLAAEIALSHHERFDGGGYPHGLKGDAIPLSARIVAVADVFDALTSVRCYKPSWSHAAAVGYLVEERGRQFDPDCVDAFLSRFDDRAGVVAA